MFDPKLYREACREITAQGVGDVGRVLAVDHQDGLTFPVLHLGLGGLHHRERFTVLGKLTRDASAPCAPPWSAPPLWL